MHGPSAQWQDGENGSWAFDVQVALDQNLNSDHLSKRPAVF